LLTKKKKEEVKNVVFVSLKYWRRDPSRLEHLYKLSTAQAINSIGLIHASHKKHEEQVDNYVYRDLKSIILHTKSKD